MAFNTLEEVVVLLGVKVKGGRSNVSAPLCQHPPETLLDGLNPWNGSRKYFSGTSRSRSAPINLRVLRFVAAVRDAGWLPYSHTAGNPAVSVLLLLLLLFVAARDRFN